MGFAILVTASDVISTFHYTLGHAINLTIFATDPFFVLVSTIIPDPPTPMCSGHGGRRPPDMRQASCRSPPPLPVRMLGPAAGCWDANQALCPGV